MVSLVLQHLSTKIALYGFTAIVILLHVIPTGGAPAFNQIEILSFRMDYLLHSALFLPWVLIAWLYLYRAGNATLKGILLIIAAGMLLAAGAEGIQYWLPYRSFNIMDVLFNVLGVVIGSVLFVFHPESVRKGVARLTNFSS